MKYFAITAFLSLLGIIGMPNKDAEDKKEHLKVQYMQFEPIYINVKK